MRYKHVVLAVMVVIGVLMLGACGSASEDVATLQSEGEQRAAPTAEVEVMDDEAKVMAFTQCLRDHGIEVLDPVLDADGNVQKPELAGGADIRKESWKEAFEECGELLEGVTWAQKRVNRSVELGRWLGIARCLAEKGYDVGEPTAEDIETWLEDLKATLDWKNPDVARAWEECSGSGKGQKRNGEAK